MKKILLNFIVLMLKIFYFPFNFLKVQDKVSYISRQSNRESIDFRLLRNEMEKTYPKTKNVILTKKIENGIINKIKYTFHIFKQMYHISTSKVIILDTYCIPISVLKHKKETKVIQIWHALAAMKKFGYQSIGTESGSDEITAKVMCMHKNYDYVLAPSEITAKYYKQGFNITDEKIKYLGMPRIDYILEKDEETKSKIYEKYHILKDKINILYFPTFRKGKKIQFDELVEKIDTNKYNLIIKLHPLDMETYTYKEKNGVIYDIDFGTYDLLKIADIVITDYSSLAMESALLNKPVYFYTYDIEEYKKTPGLNFDFENEEIAKYQSLSIDELLNKMKEEYDMELLKTFAQKYISVPKNNCTKRIVSFMMEEKNESN